MTQQNSDNVLSMADRLKAIAPSPADKPKPKSLYEKALYEIDLNDKDLMNTFVTVVVQRTSPFSGKQNVRHIQMRPGDYHRWKQGVMIQNAFSYMSADDREFLMTGITPEEWPGDPSEAADHDDGPQAA